MADGIVFDQPSQISPRITVGGECCMTERSKTVQLSVAAIAKAGSVPATAFDPIAAALRQIHDKVTGEAIPDDFMRLLDQFDDEDPAS